MSFTDKKPDLGVQDGSHDWEQKKDIIRNLYIAQNFTLQRLIHEMKSIHDFDAT
jgi:hypothetical protein